MTQPHQPDPDTTGAYAPPAAAARFEPGAVLAGRYRMVAPLGRGGMGEVWRADDLALGQPVALKFLPEPLAGDPDRLQRLRKEVALARRVSHPNCCRVYDLAGDGGRPFLTMEFVDGEDLAGLLRRVGRLPEEKAVEAARQLCAALAAVHAQGVLHRDLKPANVMLDGRGKVRLADFGLAAAAAEAGEDRPGTPAYMAPEQLTGQPASERSDLYALGLVLYELFTGRRAFEGAGRDAPPSRPSRHVSGLAPAVERTILRCLEKDPAARPASAYEVLAGLPGGDPLAAALAAGETPSPRLVADAGGEGTIRPGVGLALVGVVLGGLALVALLADRVMLFRKVPLPEPPEALARGARQILERCGHTDPPADAAYYFRVDAEYFRHVLSEAPSPGRWDGLAAVRPAPVYFFYRQSPRPMASTDIASRKWVGLLASDDSPPPGVPGMAGVHLDPDGRLRRLYVLPPRHSDARPTPAEPDWRGWFDPQTVGFDLARDLEPAAPRWAPPGACDRQAAWAGTLPGRPDVPVRVEAAAYRGRPVYFEVIPRWRDAGAREGGDPIIFGPPVLGPVLLAGVALLAARNLRRGRGDVRGAVRLGAAILAVIVGGWLVSGYHLASYDRAQLIVAAGAGGLLAAVYGLGYLAMEPAVRRRWPWRLTAWNRLLAGRLRDPMVGRDLLIGLAVGAGRLVVLRAQWLSAAWAGVPPAPLSGTGPNPLEFPGPPTPLGTLVSFLVVPVIIPVLYLLLSFLFFLVLRREWAAWGAVWLWFVAAFAAPLLGPSPAENVVAVFWTGLYVGLSVFALARFGLLAMAASLLCSEMLSLVPLTADLSAWYAYQGVVAALLVAGLAGYAFLTATGGRRLSREGFFGDD
jgi:serine/threonine-protein kinase